MTTDSADASPVRGEVRQKWYAAGGVTFSVLGASCCILPLALVLLGVSGSWMSRLHALEPYSRYFAAIALGFLGLGFRQVYFTPKADCADGTHCATPASTVLMKTALWIGTVLVVLSLTKGLWAPLFY